MIIFEEKQPNLSVSDEKPSQKPSNLTENGHKNGHKNGHEQPKLMIPEFSSQIVEDIYKALKLNRKAKYSWLQDNLGVSEATIKRAIADLKELGYQNLKPEKSHYLSLNAELRTQVIAVSITGFLNRINDMVVKQNIAVDDASLTMLQREFPEMTDVEASKLVSYALYQNSDKGDVKGVQLNLSANIYKDLNLSANYIYTYARTKSGNEWTLLERSIRHAATIAVNYHHLWGKYGLNVNLNGRLQSKTYYNDYEDAPGFGLWNLNTIHTIKAVKGVVIEPSIGIENIFDRVDRRIDSSNRKYALYTPGRMLVVGLKFKI